MTYERSTDINESQEDELYSTSSSFKCRPLRLLMKMEGFQQVLMIMTPLFITMLSKNDSSLRWERLVALSDLYSCKHDCVFETKYLEEYEDIINITLYLMKHIRTTVHCFWTDYLEMYQETCKEGDYIIFCRKLQDSFNSISRVICKWNGKNLILSNVEDHLLIFENQKMTALSSFNTKIRNQRRRVSLLDTFQSQSNRRQTGIREVLARFRDWISSHLPCLRRRFHS